MRKTKIVCTLGPSTDQPGILRQLLENGMNVARFNFSHGDYAEHKGRLDQLRALSKELDVSIPAMLDTKGPEIRLGEFENGKEQLTAGQKFILTSRNVKGTKEISSITRALCRIRAKSAPSLTRTCRMMSVLVAALCWMMA